ncbi:NAD-dependent succinate-semialdehyde dehydrogenase [Aureimonas sp. SA4125]|uniref:NAD-dependent succinate-semialdehyde dehydrogenase n=1 Tax=Aureimonas sp. SA4125 TaxID=2826993 RepID=UPI001CC43A57|nr:NAD-dependent succinate-semialdehyde dehydrogenase [Aureimonas sp. SA4125]
MAKSINPATGETIADYPEHSDADIEQALASADDAFRNWRATRFAERTALLLRAADLLDERRDLLAEIATREMGKRLVEARAEVDKCAAGCRFYAENAEKFLADDVRDGPAGRNFVAYRPLGPVLAVMPWNFPFWQVLRFAAPAIMAGNVGLLKHASNVSHCATEIEKIFTDAGAPRGVFQTLIIPSSKVEGIIGDSRIKAATLTGSEPAGRAVAAQAGQQLKPVVLELGGSDPFIVMPSADLAKAAEVGVKARMQNNGQSCIAAKRFIVHADVYDDYLERFRARVEAMTVGDPMDDTTDMGPLATTKIRDELAGQVSKSVAMGARLVIGGTAPEGKGNFYQPTIIADIPEDAPAYREELFGPCATFFKVDSIDAAIALANDSDFGLSSSAWTTDAGEQDRFARELEAGGTYINRMTASDQRLPFGGIKNSGYGRELSHEGIHEFVNVKTVTID